MSEAALHAAVHHYLTVALPAGAIHHHSPNEGRRGWKAQRAIKQQGVRPGWPDIEIIWKGRAYFVELKFGKNKLTPAQKNTIQALRDCGSPVALCRTIGDVHSFLKAYMPLRAS